MGVGGGGGVAKQYSLDAVGLLALLAPSLLVGRQTLTVSTLFT